MQYIYSILTGILYTILYSTIVVHYYINKVVQIYTLFLIWLVNPVDRKVGTGGDSFEMFLFVQK